MKKTTLGTFLENFGKVEVAIEHGTFMKLGNAKLRIEVWRAPTQSEILVVDVNRRCFFRNYRILRQLHKYQIAYNILPEIINADAYEVLEDIIVRFIKYPFPIFHALNKRKLKKVRNMTSTKSIALTDEVPDLSDFKTVLILGKVNTELIELKAQNLFLLADAAFNLTSTDSSCVIIEKKIKGNIQADYVEMGPHSTIHGDIEVEQLVLSPGSEQWGQIKLVGSRKS